MPSQPAFLDTGDGDPHTPPSRGWQPAAELDEVTAAQIAEELRALGYDARAHTRSPHDQEDQYESGVLIHAVYVEGWRYPDGRWEFIQRPAELIERDPLNRDTRLLVVPNEATGGGGRYDVPDYGSASAIAAWVAHWLPAPNKPCSGLFRHFNDLDYYHYDPPEQWYWAWRDHLFSDLYPHLAAHGYTPQAARLGEQMSDPRSLIESPETGVCRLSPDAPLPEVLRDRLGDLRISTVGCGGFTFGGTWDPLDWPALIAELPEHLAWDSSMLAANHGPDPATIETAYATLKTADAQPSLYVDLSIGPDGRVEVFPMQIWASEATDLETINRISRLLHDATGRDCWRSPQTGGLSEDPSRPEWELI